MISIFSTGHSLSCSCFYYLDNIPTSFTPPECTADRKCHNATACYVRLDYSRPSTKLTYGCLTDQQDVSIADITCAIDNLPGSVLECCNDTDYCNSQLNPTPPHSSPPSTAVMSVIMSSPRPTLKPTVMTHGNSEHKEREGGTLLDIDLASRSVEIPCQMYDNLVVQLP